MESRKAYGISAKELAGRGKKNIPEELISNKHLIYSSPATLAFNSPGAQGYGVKRAGLSIPESVMLIVSPGCCGRNTTILKELPGYEDRFFFLLMDETDIVTGRHLKKIPEAVKEVCDCLEKRPSAVMICITCVDALLGTDMERVCSKAQEYTKIPVLPCYMYALTREGRKPPMVHVRQSVYSLIKRDKIDKRAVNLMGYFAPLVEDCELYELLRSVGITRINEIGRCETFKEYQKMGRANFNLILNPEARYAAQGLQKRWNMPSVELARLYRIEKIKKQYQLFAGALGVSFHDQEHYRRTKECIDQFYQEYSGEVFAIGEGCNANPYELALALLEYGFAVKEVFGNITEGDFVYISQIAKISPETMIRSNLEPSMIYYKEDPEVTVAVGKDAAYYYPKACRLEWNEDIQPFGYAGVRRFVTELRKALDQKKGEA